MKHEHTILTAGITRTELMIVLVILGGLFASLYPALERTQNSKGPHGETYPSAGLNEANRITHPTGLSIILPANWDDLSGRSPILRIAARGMPMRRQKSVISIRQSDSEPDQRTLDRCKKLQFQNSPAYEMCIVGRKKSFDDPASSSYDLYVHS